jgi:hypothetical protein
MDYVIAQVAKAQRLLTSINHNNYRVLILAVRSVRGGMGCAFSHMNSPSIASIHLKKLVNCTPIFGF